MSDCGLGHLTECPDRRDLPTQCGSEAGRTGGDPTTLSPSGDCSLPLESRGKSWLYGQGPTLCTTHSCPGEQGAPSQGQQNSVERRLGSSAVGQVASPPPIRSSLKSCVSLPGPTPGSTSPVPLLCKAAVPQFPHQLEGYTIITFHNIVVRIK